MPERARAGGGWGPLLGVALAAAAVPFLLVEFPPIHDLPHHAAQARLWVETGDFDASPYRSQWLAPQNLIYVILVPLWSVLPGLVASKVFVYLLLAGTIAALFHLARRRGRSSVAALGAAVFAFNFLFYAGFFAFQLGGILALLWLASLPGVDQEATAAAKPPSRAAARWLGRALFMGLLAWAHTLWYAFVGLVLLIRVGRSGASRSSLGRLTTVVPAAIWLLPRLTGVVESRADGGFPMGPSWEPLFSFRLTPSALVDGALGGLQGAIEPSLLAATAVWIGLALWTNRRERWDSADKGLLGIAAIFGILWLLSPDAMAMTVQASRRWLPYAAMLTLLALPLPRIRLDALRAAVVVAQLVLLGATVNAWRFYDRVELSGFRESLAALPGGSSLLGLSFLPSEHLKHGVFLQTYAWAEVFREAELNMSFTELGAGLVLLEEPRETPWTYGLSFFPHTARPSDFYYFDYVLVSGGEDIHAQVERMERIASVTEGLPWRLYRVSSRTDAIP